MTCVTPTSSSSDWSGLRRVSPWARADGVRSVSRKRFTKRSVIILKRKTTTAVRGFGRYRAVVKH